MGRREKGQRVGAILGSKDGVVRFFGYGVYVGDEVPPEEAGGFNFGQPNPRIDLDSGETVYGCECWWGAEESIKEKISAYEKVEIITVSDARSEA